MWVSDALLTATRVPLSCALRRRLDKQFQLELPDAAARAAILSRQLGGKMEEEVANSLVELITARTEGALRDTLPHTNDITLYRLVRSSAQEAVHRSVHVRTTARYHSKQADCSRRPSSMCSCTDRKRAQRVCRCALDCWPLQLLRFFLKLDSDRAPKRPLAFQRWLSTRANC